MINALIRWSLARVPHSCEAWVGDGGLAGTHPSPTLRCAKDGAPATLNRDATQHQAESIP